MCELTYKKGWTEYATYSQCSLKLEKKPRKQTTAASWFVVSISFISVFLAVFLSLENTECFSKVMIQNCEINSNNCTVTNEKWVLHQNKRSETSLFVQLKELHRVFGTEMMKQTVYWQKQTEADKLVSVLFPQGLNVCCYITVHAIINQIHLDKKQNFQLWAHKFRVRPTVSKIQRRTDLESRCFSCTPTNMITSDLFHHTSFLCWFHHCWKICTRCMYTLWCGRLSPGCFQHFKTIFKPRGVK